MGERIGSLPGVIGFAIGAAACLVCAIAGVVVLRRKSRLIATMKRTPTSRIASAQPGIVELAGVATPADAGLTAPLTGVPCVYYRVAVEEGAGSSRSTLLDEDKWCDFYVDDGSGAVALVTGEIVHVKTATRVAAAEHEGAVQRLLRARGIQKDDGAMNQLTWFEQRIDAGATVYVLGEGRAATPRGPDAAYRGGTRERFIVVAPAGGELVVSVGSEEALAAKLRGEVAFGWKLVWGAVALGVMFTVAALAFMP